MKSPFDNLSKLQINKLFDLLEVHRYKFSKNEEILSTIKNKNIICIILDGSAQILYIEFNGNEILVENLVKDSVFGNADFDYHKCPIWISLNAPEMIEVDE